MSKEKTNIIRYSFGTNLITAIFLLLIPTGFVLHYNKYYETGLIILIVGFLGISFMTYIVKNKKMGET